MILRLIGGLFRVCLFLLKNFLKNFFFRQAIRTGYSFIDYGMILFSAPARACFLKRFGLKNFLRENFVLGMKTGLHSVSIFLYFGI